MTGGLGSSWFIGPFPHIAQRVPGGPFGSPSAIAPHFNALEPAEQASAVNLMLERGDDIGKIACSLGLSRAAIEAISIRRCQPISLRGESEATDGRSKSGLLARPVSKVAASRALDQALEAVDALRLQAGAPRGAMFEMTLEELCQACGFGLETARRRFRDLEARKWVRRTLRPGQPALVTITLTGRCRLKVLGRLDGPASGKGRAEP